MNKNVTFNYICLLEEIQFWEVMKNTYPSQDLGTIQINGFSLSTLSLMHQRIISQFKERLRHEDFELLPDHYYHPDVDPEVKLVTDYLMQLYQSFADKNIEETVKAIRWLVSYQITYEFWNTPIVRIKEVTDHSDINNKEKPWWKRSPASWFGR